jgi:dolichol-phosphate mannosyltransferase
MSAPDGAGPGRVLEPGRILVIVPTYNERDNLDRILDRLAAAVPAADVLVVDDGSPDGTGDLADARAARDDRVHVLHRAAKSGLGGAYIAGFRWGLDRGYGALVEMDADGSHAPEQLPGLLAGLAGADVVLGSRWVEGGSVVDWPKRREFLSRGGNAYARLALGLPVRDATGGFRVYRREVLAAMELGEIASQGYCFQVDLVVRAWKAGWRVTEVPIRFVERSAGVSKMDRSIVTEALWRITVWGVQSRLRRRKSQPQGQTQPR